mgnify:CR=1 FL=1
MVGNSTCGKGATGNWKYASKPANATWDPIQFAVEPLQSMGLQDIDPSRAGTQVRVMLDVSRSQMPASSFNAYMKYVNQAAVNMGITDLNGNAITAAGWYDFTQKVAGGDGARFITAGGLITAIELIITDNAFGDDDPTVGRIYDPGVPVNNTPTPTPAPAPAYYPVVPTVNSQTTNDTTPVLTGTAEAGSTVRVTVGGATFQVIADSHGLWSLDTGAVVPVSGSFSLGADGLKNVHLTSTDAAGQSTVGTGNFTLDTTAPDAPTFKATDDVNPVSGDIANDGSTNDNQPTFTGTAEPNATVKLYDQGQLIGTVTADAKGDWRFTPTTALTDGATMSILASKTAVRDLGLTPKMRMVSFAFAGVDPNRMGLGPIPATEKALKLAGLSFSDICEELLRSDGISLESASKITCCHCARLHGVFDGADCLSSSIPKEPAGRADESPFNSPFTPATRLSSTSAIESTRSASYNGRPQPRRQARCTAYRSQWSSNWHCSQSSDHPASDFRWHANGRGDLLIPGLFSQ